MAMALANAFSRFDWWIHAASRTLGAAGVATPRYDAERIAAYALGMTWGDVRTRMVDDGLEPQTVATLNALVERRASGEPLAYIERSRGFYGLELACGPGVLVPRPDTETLVDVALELIDTRASPIVVDIGTGTGAVAFAIASVRPDAEIVATDISDDALAYARANARSLGLDVWFAKGDLFDAVPIELRGSIDLVVSNPPYVAEGAELPPDVRAEPEIALFAGPEGTDVLRRLVREAPAWLAPGGALALEIGGAEQAGILPAGEARADLAGTPRVVWTRF
jgi:release factor glutamine methyltransferase